MSGAKRPEAIGVWVESSFKDRFEEESQGFLNNSVFDSGNTKWTLFVRAFGYESPTDRLGNITPSFNFTQDLVDKGSVLQLALVVLTCFAINSWRTRAFVGQNLDKRNFP